MVSSSNNATYGVRFITSDGAVLDTVSISLDSGGAQWGTAIWGGFVWSTSITGLVAGPQFNPHAPIVFRKMSHPALTGNSYLGFKIGDMFTRMEQLGYLQQIAS